MVHNVDNVAKFLHITLYIITLIEGPETAAGHPIFSQKVTATGTPISNP